jgi:hypothetical protein
MTTIITPEIPQTIYLKPSPKTRPIRYLESIEEAGLIVDAKHAIAMYTSKASANRGPPGEPGVDANPYDTIIASASDEFTPITVGGPKCAFRCPYPLDMTTGYVRISATLAPSGSAMVVDVLMNGVSMFNVNKIRIDSGMKTSVGSAIPSVIAIPGMIIPDDAEFLVHVISIGSTFAGTGLKVAVTGVKAP